MIQYRFFDTSSTKVKKKHTHTSCQVSTNDLDTYDGWIIIYIFITTCQSYTGKNYDVDVSPNYMQSLDPTMSFS